MSAPAPSQSTANALTSEDLSTFSDAFFDENMAALNVPGAAVVVVQGGEVLIAKGYGFSNLETGTPAGPNTVFRAGSVSKLVTATAVMMLAEQGLIDLHADVNTYLTRFQLETSYDVPVTPADLLLHTAGYDEQFIGGHARTAAEGMPLGEYLAAHMPPQILPAGKYISYNDYTMSLAGYLVEEVSGMPFDAYVEAHIFEPLGMTASTFAQPAPQAILDQLATGYRLQGSSHSPYPYDYINVGPAAALLTTAEDMARFITAHLEGGSGLMDPATLAEMHATQYQNHPKLRGRAYGFSENFVNGNRILFHDGGNPGFVSRLILVPERQIGFFVTLNLDQFQGASRLHRDFTAAFFDRYFPDEGTFTPPQRPAGLTVDTGAYTGYYRELQGYSSKTLQKLTSLDAQFEVRADDQGNLVAFGSKLIPQDENLFHWEDADSYVAFDTENGEPTYMLMGTGTFQKLAWWESRPAQYGMMAAFVLLFLSAGIAAFLPALAQLGTAGRLALGLTGWLNAVFLVGLVTALLTTDTWTFGYGLTPLMKGLLALPLLAMLAAAALVLLTGAAWAGGDWSQPARIYATLIGLAAIGFIPFLKYWNLIGWQA